MKPITLFAVLITSLLFSCTKDVLKGTGDNQTQTRTVAPFTDVETNYGIRAEITYGNSQQVVVSGHESLLNVLETSVQNGVLKLTYSRNYNNVKNENTVVRIQLPVLYRTTLHGSSNIMVNGFANGSSFEGRIEGSGSILVTGSNFASTVLSVYGSGNIEAQGLQAQQAITDIHGSGNISVSVNGQLKANIYGSGNVYYWGNAVVQTDQNGSGRVVKK